MPSRRPPLLGLLMLGAILPPGCLCDHEDHASHRTSTDLSSRKIAEENRPSSLQPPPREPGPARKEPPAKMEAATKEASGLTRALKASGVDAREVAAVADMRGYRLYRKRYFRQAQIWFEAAATADPSFEPALFNAARCAILLEHPARARALVSTLMRLNTPLAKSRLSLAKEDPDFAALWAEQPLRR